MPSQLFRVTRAPEAGPISPARIQRLIYADRTDSEWTVEEVAGKVVPVKVGRDVLGASENGG